MTRGREGWALVHQIERRGWWGDTLPGDGGPGARGGLSIFQHAPLHEWAAIRGTFLYITRKAPMSIISPLALEWFLFPLLRESQHTPPENRQKTASLKVGSISKHMRRSSAGVVTAYCLPAKWILTQLFFSFFYPQHGFANTTYYSFLGGGSLLTEKVHAHILQPTWELAKHVT